MTATVTVTGLEELQRGLAGAKGEIASAVRNTLNDTARDAQREFRGTLSTKFDVRKKTFIERQVYFGKEDQATKEKWSARLKIQGPSGKSATLEKFQEDKIKRAKDGRIAVPVREIRTGGGHVKPSVAWNKLTPLGTMSGRYTKLKKTKHGYKPVKELNSPTRTVGQRGTFLVTLKSSKLEALVRRRPGKGRGIEVLWVLKKYTPIPTSLGFDQDITAMAKKHLPVRAGQAVEHALKRAMTRGGGS